MSKGRTADMAEAHKRTSRDGLREIGPIEAGWGRGYSAGLAGGRFVFLGRSDDVVANTACHFSAPDGRGSEPDEGRCPAPGCEILADRGGDPGGRLPAVAKR